MTAAAAVPTTNDARQRLERLSAAAVLVMAAIALGIGLWLASSTAGSTERLERDGLSVAVPTGWLVSDGVGDTLFSVVDPLDPDHRYAVASVPANGGTAEDAARARLADRKLLLGGLAIESDGPGELDGLATHMLRYTYVPLGADEGTIAAIEHYVPAADRVLVLTLEAPVGEVDDAVAAFERFAAEAARSAGASAAVDSARRVASLGLGPLTASRAGGPGPVAQPPTATADLVAATVQIYQLGLQGDPGTTYGWGSGTIISPDGLILTNAHVALPSADGQGIYHRNPIPAIDPDGLVVAIVVAEDRPAVPTYRASVVAADGYLDAALIRIDRDMAGDPVDPSTLRLPFVALGDSDALRAGDPLTVVGYPGIGGDTISLSAGQVSGFLGDERIGQRAWIKTDAVVSSGNSGGLAANAADQIVGLPTLANTADTGGYSLVRPIGLVRPMIDDALAGRPSLDSAWVVPSTGQERLVLDTWTDTVTDCQPGARLRTYPTGTRQVVALFGDAGFAEGEDVLAQWQYEGQIVVRDAFLASASAPGSCSFVSIGIDRGLPDGAYRVEVFAGPDLESVAIASTAVGVPAADEAILTGRVLDVDSGHPIAGAVIFMLAPGTDAQAWWLSPAQDRLVSHDKTDANGAFRVGGLAAGETYPALVVADGYAPTGGVVGPMVAGEHALGGDVTLVRSTL
jgi:S1-C subfamily serine protease